MKVAIFEPFPRTAGVTTWAFELVHGFRDLGHTADVVSCTKSGRAKATRSTNGKPRTGWQWFDQAPDRVFTWAGAPTALDDYDLIVLNEPKNNPLDAPAKRENRVPEYVQVLQRTKTPWVTAFHDGTAYRADKAPFLALTMQLENFTGLAVQCRPGSYEAAAYATGGHVTKLLSWPWLPYRTKHADLDLLPVDERPPHVGMTGRMVSTKGYTSLLAVADQLPSPYETRLYGSESGGHAPCQTFTWFEAMVMYHGWKGLRGDPSVPSDVRTQHSIDIGNFTPINTVVPYAMRHPETGAVYRYMWAFTDRMSLYNDLRVMFMLSKKDLATTLEYAALEALDAGCVLVAPKYAVADMRGADYDVEWVDYEAGVTMPKGKGFTWRVPAEREALIHATRRAIQRTHDYDPTENWRRLDTYHAPRHLAAAILGAL
jgi:hypothetical protein